MASARFVRLCQARVSSSDFEEEAPAWDETARPLPKVVVCPFEGLRSALEGLIEGRVLAFRTDDVATILWTAEKRVHEEVVRYHRRFRSAGFRI